MKHLLILASFGLMSSGAYAADIFNGNSGNGGLKDQPVAYAPSVSHSGFYITGALGWAQLDRSISSTIAAQKNKLGTACEGDEDGCKDGFRWDNELEAGQVAGPLVFSDIFGNIKEDDQSALIFGGDLSYLFHLPNQRFGLELALGGTVYTDNETTMAIGGTPTVTALGDGFPANRYPDVGEPNLYDQVGHVKFERDFDIDLVAKGHLFVSNNMSLYAGAGLSIARASLTSAHVSDYAFADGVFDNGIDDSDTSLGYVLLAGFQWWATDRIVIGGEYSFKAHEFEFDAGRSSDAAVGRNAYRYSVSDQIDVNEDVHALKLRAGFKLN